MKPLNCEPMFCLLLGGCSAIDHRQKSRRSSSSWCSITIDLPSRWKSFSSDSLLFTILQFLSPLLFKFLAAIPVLLVYPHYLQEVLKDYLCFSLFEVCCPDLFSLRNFQIFSYLDLMVLCGQDSNKIFIEKYNDHQFCKHVENNNLVGNIPRIPLRKLGLNFMFTPANNLSSMSKG